MHTVALSIARRPGSIWAIGAALVGIVIVGSFLLVSLGRDATRDERLSTPTPFSEWTLGELPSIPAGFFKPAFSPTSDLLAAVSLDPETRMHSIFLIRPGEGEPVLLTREVEVRGPSPVFSPDGQEILFTAYRHDPIEGLIPDLWKVAVSGGSMHRLVERASAGSLSPDGAALAYAAVEPEGTAIRVQGKDGDAVEVAKAGFWPRWSPNGRWIAYTTSNPEGGDGHLWIVRPDGQGSRQLTREKGQIYGHCWTAGSERIIFSTDMDGASNLWAIDVADAELTRITRGLGYYSAPSVSRDGRRR